jgi:cytochrome c oxidase subunit 2
MFTNNLLGTFTVHADAPEAFQYGFQDPATPIMIGLTNLHHDIMFLIILIMVLVTWVLGRATLAFLEEKNAVPVNIIHASTLEVVWTIVPGIVLMIIAIPSFALLYAADELVDPAMTIKVVGHQWYWSYEYSDYETEEGESLNFDSYLVAEDDLATGSLRLLEVDNRVVVPTNTHIRVIVTAADVLHCWAVPSFGFKIDACPGRLNQSSIYVQREGVYYGQCSEICGVNHGFMPIVVEAVALNDYVSWISNKLEDI